MSWQVVAKKDFRDAVRSRAFLGLSAIFLLLVVGIAVLYSSLDEIGGTDPDALGLIFFVASSIGTFVSVAAIVVCYRAIAGERESGSVKLLLSLPHTRRDVLLGKVIGRTAVLAVPIVVALLVGTAIGTALLGAVAPVATLLFGSVALVFALAYASIMVGLSATSASTTRVAALAIGFLLLVEFLWDVVVLGLAYVATGFQFPEGAADFPGWVFAVSQLQPSTAFVTALAAVVPDAPQQGAGVVPAAGELDSVLATRWVAFLALLLWIVLPLVVGYRRFQRADL